MHGWVLIPGALLIAVGFVLQLGASLRRPRNVELVLVGIRLRFIGMGALSLTVGVDLAIRGLTGGPEPALLAVGAFILAMAGTWFYASTDRTFSTSRR